MHEQILLALPFLDLAHFHDLSTEILLLLLSLESLLLCVFDCKLQLLNLLFQFCSFFHFEVSECPINT
jgi:hypothetical protein